MHGVESAGSADVCFLATTAPVCASHTYAAAAPAAHRCPLLPTDAPCCPTARPRVAQPLLTVERQVVGWFEVDPRSQQHFTPQVRRS